MKIRTQIFYVQLYFCVSISEHLSLLINVKTTVFLSTNNLKKLKKYWKTGFQQNTFCFFVFIQK